MLENSICFIGRGNSECISFAPLILLNEFNGDWEKYQEALYQLFLNTIVGKLSFLGSPIGCRYFQPIADKHRSFWHLICSGAVEDEDRLPDMRRCERLGWIPHILNHSNTPEILCWENKRKSNINTVLWLPPEQYMIILSKRKDYYLLTSAYTHDDRKGRSNQKEAEMNKDPRNS